MQCGVELCRNKCTSLSYPWKTCVVSSQCTKTTTWRSLVTGKTDLAMYKYSLVFNPEVTEKLVQEAETAKKTVALPQEKPEGKKRGRKKKAEEEAPEVVQVSDADESDGEQVQIICNRISGHFVDIMCDLQEEPEATD